MFKLAEFFYSFDRVGSFLTPYALGFSEFSDPHTRFLRVFSSMYPHCQCFLTPVLASAGFSDQQRPGEPAARPADHAGPGPDGGRDLQVPPAP